MALQLDPLYDAIFECPKCGVVFHGPGPLEDHDRDVHAEVVPPHAAGAVPEHATVEVKKPPKTYTCRFPECGVVVIGFDKFMAHRRAHLSAGVTDANQES